MKKELHIRDIPDKEILEYQGRRSRSSLQETINMPFVYEFFADRWPEKLIYAKPEKHCKQGYIGYVTSLRTGWLTEKGKQYLSSLL
jgi:hypothetical protein